MAREHLVQSRQVHLERSRSEPRSRASEEMSCPIAQPSPCTRVVALPPSSSRRIAARVTSVITSFPCRSLIVLSFPDAIARSRIAPALPCGASPCPSRHTSRSPPSALNPVILHPSSSFQARYAVSRISRTPSPLPPQGASSPPRTVLARSPPSPPPRTVAPPATSPSSPSAARSSPPRRVLARAPPAPTGVPPPHRRDRAPGPTVPAPDLSRQDLRAAQAVHPFSFHELPPRSVARSRLALEQVDLAPAARVLVDPHPRVAALFLQRPPSRLERPVECPERRRVGHLPQRHPRRWCNQHIDVRRQPVVSPSHRKQRATLQRPLAISACATEKLRPRSRAHPSTPVSQPPAPACPSSSSRDRVQRTHQPPRPRSGTPAPACT